MEKMDCSDHGGVTCAHRNCSTTRYGGCIRDEAEQKEGHSESGKEDKAEAEKCEKEGDLEIIQ